MNLKSKIVLIIIAIFSVIVFTSKVNAASASISANKTSVTVGTKVTVTVKINAAAWNLNVSGSAADSIVGFNMDATNQSTTKTYVVDTSKAGTYKVTLSGDITDESEENARNVSDSVTITVKEKTTNTTTNNTTTNNNTTTTVKKSSNANISKLTLSVEGLSFNKNQTTYNIKVGENVEQISVGVTVEHKKSTYKVTGNKGITAGNNVIKIVVTAEDGTTKTYKINVEKQGNLEDTSAELSNLIIENMTFETPFEATQTDYVGSKMKYVESLNVLPYTMSEKATYEIIGNENLKEGENTITIKVTSYDETNVVEYKVTFEMMSKEETNAMQQVNNTPTTKEEKEEDEFKQAIIDHSTIILLYLLALIEFGQVVYLYIELKKVNPSSVIINKRRRNKTNSENKDKENN